MKIQLLISVLFLSFCFSYSITFSQNDTPDTSFADSLLKNGNDFIAINKFDSAIVCLQKAKKSYETYSLWENYISCNNSIGSALRQKGLIDSSITLLESTLEFANGKMEKENPVIIKTKNQLGQSYRAKGNFDRALSLALENLDYLLQKEDGLGKSENYFLLGMAFSDKGEFNVSLNNLELALMYLEKDSSKLSAQSFDSKLAGIYNGMAGSFHQMGNYDLAIEYYKKTLESKIKAFGESHSDIGSIYNNLAAAYFYMEDNSTALEYYYKALSIDRQTKAPDDLTLGYRYNNIAMAYRVNKEYEEALKYCDYAKEIFFKKLGGKHPGFAGVINNTGRIYSDMNQFDKAIELYESALSVWKDKYGEEHHLTAQSYFNIGEALGNKRDYDSALSMLNKSLTVRLSVFGGKHPKVAESYEGLARIYNAKQNFDSALVLSEKAITSLSKEFYESKQNLNPEPNNIIWANESLSPLLLKGEIYASIYQRSGNLNDLISGLSSFQFASQLVSKIRHGFKSEGSKLSFSDRAFSIYEKGINTALKLFALTKNEEFRKTAFKFSEESKAALLFDAVSESKARSFAGIPDSLLEKEKNARIDMASLETQIVNERQKKLPSTEVINLLEDKYFSLHQGYMVFLKNLEKNYNSYYNLKYKERSISVEKIRKKLAGLPEEGIILEYFLSDTALYIFTLDKNNLDVITVKPETHISKLVIQLRQSLQNLEFNKYASSATSLYNILIKPLGKKISGYSNLYIIPDGILNYLPFEALLTKKIGLVEERDFSSLPYLINKHTISYLLSAEFLLEENETADRSSFAGFAPVFQEDNSISNSNNLTAANDQYQAVNARVIKKDSAALSLKRAVEVNDKKYSALPESKYEVENIISLFKKRNLIAFDYIYEKAREEILKSEGMSDYRIIHIASHGFINEEKPKYSGILLTDKNNQVEDGILYSSEIYNLNLNADLVVLSACESGLGQIVKGEGIIGLTRGFFYSGAKNIVVSLWQVADKSTAELMIEFYKNILDGKSYASSMRKAKLELIKAGSYAYPLEWAPFILFGK